MAITKLQAEALNLADTFAFTGTVTGAGGANTPAFAATQANTGFSAGGDSKMAFATKFLIQIIVTTTLLTTDLHQQLLESICIC